MRKLIKPSRPNSLKSRKQNSNKNGDTEKKIPENPIQQSLLEPDIENNLQRIKEVFKDCSDVVYREFLFAQQEDIKLALVYMDGLVDETIVSDQIMKALTLEAAMATPPSDISKARAYHLIKERGLCTQQIKETVKLAKVVDAVLAGDTVLLVDGHASAIINGARGWKARQVEDAKTEMSIRSPREAFVETLRVNTALLRRKIKSTDLKMEMLKIGRLTQTDVAVVYIQGIVNDGLVKEVKKRLQRIDIDGVLESGYLEEMIQDNPFSPFPNVNHTERPDRLAAKILEGRVGIMVDGTPFVLTVPTTFFEYMQAAEDYYERFPTGTAVRVIRYLSLVLSLLAPSLYIAQVSFHQEMLPTSLLLSLAAQREAVPFPVLVEALLMEISFEILREAGLRLPRQVGQAVSIVGALIVGQAAVQAGLVAPATVITVAITGISSFVFFYQMGIAIRLLRFPLMVLSATLGLFGLISGIILIITHLCTMRSFGTPYLSPVAPMKISDMKDYIFRAPRWAMIKRPSLLGVKNVQRMKRHQKPKPPENQSGAKGGTKNHAGRGKNQH
ncbi:spore germination protein [Desulforamulus ruminis]|uniref:GerA spore germination protein n=1 Tax=Desulforamulus ruminis (strain ATCC 23193 / DSM 2154 / NCIMB 8452 / DL) TaxID=696281 RepID=F6DKP1_DESRL|nr:spore germination protein [Desulforamulus ruminis]AEG60416.1 GerA spore germination protein [Desulforamulus ruminis DSM 2154]